MLYCKESHLVFPLAELEDSQQAFLLGPGKAGGAGADGVCGRRSKSERARRGATDSLCAS